MRPFPLRAVESQDGEVGRAGGSADHPLRDRAAPLAVAAAHLQVPRPEPAAQVSPGVDHRAEGVRPQPQLQLQPPAELLALLARVELEVHVAELFGHRLGEFLPHLRVLRGSVVRRGDGHEPRVEVAAQHAAELRLVQVLLPGVEHRVRLLLDDDDGQGVAGDGSEVQVRLGQPRRQEQQERSHEAAGIHVGKTRVHGPQAGG